MINITGSQVCGVPVLARERILQRVVVFKLKLPRFIFHMCVCVCGFWNKNIRETTTINNNGLAE